MRTIRPRLGAALAALPAILAALALAGCEGGTGVEALGGVPQGTGVSTVVVSPSSATLTAIGALQQFTATAEDSLGLPVAGVHFTWSSQDTTVVTVDANGVARAVANGTTGVTAQSGGVTGTASVTVSAP
jgi:uncharacterized protein YjdB